MSKTKKQSEGIADTGIRYTIASKQANCVGVMAQKCLQIKKGNQKEWENFYDSIEGFTYEEMSKIIDIPIGTVRSRLHRARNMLKDVLKEYAKQMGYKDDVKEK